MLLSTARNVSGIERVTHTRPQRLYKRIGAHKRAGANHSFKTTQSSLMLSSAASRASVDTSSHAHHIIQWPRRNSVSAIPCLGGPHTLLLLGFPQRVKARQQNGPVVSTRKMALLTFIEESTRSFVTAQEMQSLTSSHNFTLIE